MERILVKRADLDFRGNPLKTLKRKDYEAYIFSLKDSYYPYNDSDKSKYTDYYTYQIVNANGEDVDEIQPDWEIFETMSECIRKANDDLDYLQDKYDEESELQDAFVMEALREDIDVTNDKELLNKLSNIEDNFKTEPVYIQYQPTTTSVIDNFYIEKAERNFGKESPIIDKIKDHKITYSIIVKPAINGAFVTVTDKRWSIDDFIINPIITKRLEDFKKLLKKENAITESAIQNISNDKELKNLIVTAQKSINPDQKFSTFGHLILEIIYRPAGYSVLNKIYQNKLDNLPSKYQDAITQRALQRLANNKSEYYIKYAIDPFGDQYVDVDDNKGEHRSGAFTNDYNSVYSGPVEEFLDLLEENRSVLNKFFKDINESVKKKLTESTILNNSNDEELYNELKKAIDKKQRVIQIQYKPARYSNLNVICDYRLNSDLLNLINNSEKDNDFGITKDDRIASIKKALQKLDNNDFKYNITVYNTDEDDKYKSVYVDDANGRDGYISGDGFKTMSGGGFKTIWHTSYKEFKNLLNNKSSIKKELSKMNIKESRRLSEARTLKNSTDEKLLDSLKKAIDRGQKEIEINYQPAGDSVLNKIFKDILDKLPQGKEIDGNKLELDTGNIVVSKAIVDKSRRELAIESALKKLANNTMGYNILYYRKLDNHSNWIPTITVNDGNEREGYDILGLKPIWYGKYENFLNLFNKNESVNFLAELKK